MHRGLHTKDAAAEGDDAVERAERVIGGLVRLDLGQAEAAEQQRQDREGQPGGEHPGPRRDGQNRAAGGGRQCSGHRHHHAVDAEPASELARRIDRSDQRRHHAQRRRRPQRLRGAHHQQEGQRLGEETQPRRDGEDELADLVEPLQSDPVAQRREGQQRHHQHELIDGDDQHRRRSVHFEIARDGGQRHAHDLAVDHRQDRAQRDRRDRQIAPGRGHAVGGKAATVFAVGLAGREVGGGGADHAGVTKLSRTCLVPACSNAMASLFPSTDSTMP